MIQRSPEVQVMVEALPAILYALWKRREGAEEKKYKIPLPRHDLNFI